jgi:tetratricopeptide (TPR) repeat protein
MKIEAQIKALFEKIIPYVFTQLDTYLPNDDLRSTRFPQRKRLLETPLPKYEIKIDGVQISITCQGFEFRGTPAGFLSMVGGLWGAARGKVHEAVPCIRYLYAVGVALPDGIYLTRDVMHEFAEDFVTIICEMKASGIPEYKSEIELLLVTVQDVFHYDQRLIPIGNEKLLKFFSKKELDEALNSRYIDDVNASTHQAIIKKLITSRYFSSKNYAERLVLVRKLHGHISNTDSNLLRVQKIFAEYESLFLDPHPLIRDVMWITLDRLVSNLFYDQAYKYIVPDLTKLIDKGVNLDINLARRYECYMALGQYAEAQSDLDALNKITKPWEIAPAQYSGLNTKYPNYEYWTLFSKLRVASAHLTWAQGADPCEHVLVSKKKSEMLVAEADKHNKAAEKLILEVAQRGSDLLSTCTAFEVGDIFTHLRRELVYMATAELYGKVAKKYIEQSHFSEFIEKSKIKKLEKIEIKRVGVYKKIEGRRYEFLHDAFSLEPQIGEAVGIEYVAHGTPILDELKTNIEVSYSPHATAEKEKVASYESVTYVGIDNAFYWLFENEDDMKRGFWSINISIQTEGEEAKVLMYDFEMKS